MMVVETLLAALTCLHPAIQDRRPVPEAAALKESQQVVRDLFKEDYARKAPADRLALSRRLFEQGVAAKEELALQFVLLSEARDIASLAGDVRGAMKAVGELAQRFEVNGAELRLPILTAAAKSSQSLEEMASTTRSFLAVADEAIALADFETADKAADQAKSLSRKAKDPLLSSRADAKVKETADLLSRLLKSKKARLTLETNPQDAAANATVGTFECLLKGNWAGGLPLLANGTEGPLKSAAARDASSPTEALQQLQAGDAWWDLAEKETGVPRFNLRHRSAYWYELSIPALSGIQKAKAEKRVQALRQEALFRGSWIELPDPMLFGQRGLSGESFVLSPAVGFTASTSEAKLPKGDFDGISVRVGAKAGSTATALVVYQDKAFGALLNLKTSRFSLALLKGEFWHETQGGPCPKQEEYVITVLFLGGEHVYYLDGKEQFRYRAEGQIQGLKLQASDGPMSFGQIKLRARY